MRLDTVTLLLASLLFSALFMAILAVMHTTGRSPVAALVADAPALFAYSGIHVLYVATQVAGDRVLAGVAALLRRALRGHDVLGRYDGEEFAVLLPGVDGDEAQAIAAARYDTPAGALQVTASIGVAVSPDGHGRVEDLVAPADRGLYDAKRAGRNRIGGPALLAPDAQAAAGPAVRAPA